VLALALALPEPSEMRVIVTLYEKTPIGKPACAVRYKSDVGCKYEKIFNCPTTVEMLDSSETVTNSSREEAGVASFH
jgi:hypothetical protein